MGIEEAVGGVFGGILGGLFGGGGGGGNFDISGLIRMNEANQNQFMALMEENERNHKEAMQLLTEEINAIKDRNQKIIDSLREEIKKKDEEYQNKKREKKAKKELKQKKANDQLIKDINSSRASILQEIENDFDNSKDLYCTKEIEKLKLSNEIEDLFITLFQSENISQIFLKIILEKIKYFKYEKKIKCYNIQIIGRTGVGKSTLINTLLRTKISKTSFGRVGTLETKEYYSDKFPFIRFIDTRGTELCQENNIYAVKKNTLDYIKKRLLEEDPNRTIHCLLYCIQGNRFEEIEKVVISELRKEYKDGKLPIIIVYTQSYFDEDFEEMKTTINNDLKSNELTEIGERVEDINFVGVVAEKKGKIKPCGLDKLLNYLKLKAKDAFIIATINMIKAYCKKIVEILLSETLNTILSNKNDFFQKVEKDNDNIIYITLKNVFLKFVPQKKFELSENSEKALKEISEKLSLKIDEIQKKKLSEFTNENSEKVGSKIDKTQSHVINQNLGVALNIKDFSQFKNEGKYDLDKNLKLKSIKYSKINFAKKLYEKTAVRFKNLFIETIDDLIENEQEINELVKGLNNNISEDITSKIDNLIEEIKKYQEGESV